MKIRVTWHKSDGTNPATEWKINPNDPQGDDSEWQLVKAFAAAQVDFNNEFGETPLRSQLEASLIKE